MTLAEWEEAYNHTAYSHPTGARYVHDRLAGNDKTSWDMFHLSDYVVTSLTGGCYWLVKRDKESRQGNA